MRLRGEQQLQRGHRWIEHETQQAFEHPGTLRARRGLRAEPFDRFRELCSGRHRCAERSDESLDEALRFDVAATLGCQRIREQLHMLVERARNPQQPAVHVHQVVLRDRLVEHAVHRLADDGRLEKRARVQADNGGAVVHRVEVVVLRLVIDWMRPPERDVLEARKIDVLPLLGPHGVRTNEDADVLQPRVVARANRLDPALDELRLACRAAEER